MCPLRCPVTGALPRWTAAKAPVAILAPSYRGSAWVVRTVDLPRDLPVVERTAVRLVVLDAEGRVLLFRIHEPQHPEMGTVWELPGGGVDAGETYVEAGLRELREESGIVARPADVHPPSWRRRATFRHAGERRLQHEVVALVRVHELAPPVDQAAQTADEIATYYGFRWWSVDEIESSDERFYPGRLPTLLRRFLGGEHIDEPFEYFS
jgi:8-oxo-dGTP pyrophosphatase MutT (NUDIX family)